MPPRPANTSGHLHKKRRPVSIISSRESSLSPLHHVSWGSNHAFLPYHEDEYQRAITVPHPHYQKSNTTQGYGQVPDELYGVPVLSDQVEFNDELDASMRRGKGKEPYLKRVFRKGAKQDATPATYPPELAKMTVPERQELADQARRNSFDRQEIHGEDRRPTEYHRHAKSKKSVSWHPDLGSPMTTSSPSIPADGPTSTQQFSSDWQSDDVASSVGSDKTVWPFTRKPRSLFDKRARSSPGSAPSTMNVDPLATATQDEPIPSTGFEFTPRIYVPLWKPSLEEPLAQEELPSTPQPSPSRYRRTMSICHARKPPTPASAPSSYPPAFTQPQLSPSHFPCAPGSSAAGWPSLPAFGSMKVYTPSPSPHEHTMADLHRRQVFQADLGNAKVKWDPVDFRNGDAEASPSRTFRYAAEEWLRTR